MEIFRRLGIADKMRNAGLPADYPHDISYRTSFTGAGADTDPGFPAAATASPRPTAADGNWPTPEPPHRINQIFLEPILFEHAAAQKRIAHRQPDLGRRRGGGGRVRERHACATSTAARCAASSAAFLIGCDGARSVVRKAIGAEFSGDAIIQRVQSTFIRAPGLIDRQRHPTRLGHRRHQSAPLRHGLCDRRKRALAGAQLSSSPARMISMRSIAMAACGRFSGSTPISDTSSSRKRTGTAAG